MFPPIGEVQHTVCSCSWRREDELEPDAGFAA
jgi:hypothetical protein